MFFNNNFFSFIRFEKTLLPVFCNIGQSHASNTLVFQDRVGILSQTIQVKHPGGMITKYSVNFGDETILAAMSLFYPDMFGLRGDNLWHTCPKSQSDPEDPHDDDYLAQTQSRQEQVSYHGSKR